MNSSFFQLDFSEVKCVEIDGNILFDLFLIKYTMLHMTSHTYFAHISFIMMMMMKMLKIDMKIFSQKVCIDVEFYCLILRGRNFHFATAMVTTRA